jgi:hypothetical protein
MGNPFAAWILFALSDKVHCDALVGGALLKRIADGVRLSTFTPQKVADFYRVGKGDAE